MPLIRRNRRNADQAETAPERVCFDGISATVIERTTDFVTVKLDDGTQPSVRPHKVTTCTCGGRGCK
ncbi:hypothetical protein [Nonomuraea basaltis]|uniref:hypothetical protein n=1 Tax=Nonomuraea basaltis TaxID=2495887 RepID=UPI00110C5296|nr:hypothetical protein [Nonomuraea basaltis]TMR93305.1 hypothetical protein EJK15_40110 [Nonomuraea basaltis]